MRSIVLWISIGMCLYGWYIFSFMMTSSNGDFSVILAICAGNSPVTGEFPAQRTVTWSFSVFFDLCLNKRLSKQSWDWWFETPSRPLWRHCNVISNFKRSCLVIMGVICRNHIMQTYAPLGTSQWWLIFGQNTHLDFYHNPSNMLSLHHSAQLET